MGTRNIKCVGTPTCHHSYFLYSALRFASQLSCLCLHTHPCTDPDNCRLIVMAYSVLRFSSQQDPFSINSDSRTESYRNCFSITHQRRQTSRNLYKRRVIQAVNSFTPCRSESPVGRALCRADGPGRGVESHCPRGACCQGHYHFTH